MKKSITKQQWDELTDEEKDRFYDTAEGYEDEQKYNLYPYLSIGQMIEYLEEDLIEIRKKYKGETYLVRLVIDEDPEKLEYETFEGENICDSLWLAVKWKASREEREKELDLARELTGSSNRELRRVMRVGGMSLQQAIKYLLRLK